MTMGEIIRKRRTMMNMSQDDLAKLLGYKSRASINKIENGQTELTQKKIVEFARALHTTTTYLMGGPEADNFETVAFSFKIPEDDKRLILLYDKASPEDKRIVDMILAKYE